MQPNKRDPKRFLLVIISFYQFACSAWFINLTKCSADNPGGNPKTVGDIELHLRSKLKAGERMLMQSIQERNKLQDANLRLIIELKDVRAQLADSMKENKKLHRGIYGKNASELFNSSVRKSIKKIFPCRNVNGPP